VTGPVTSNLSIETNMIRASMPPPRKSDGPRELKKEKASSVFSSWIVPAADSRHIARLKKQIDALEEIINIGSRVNTVAPAKSVISSASKAAVDAITKVLSKELGPRKIRVNSLNPGVITTEGFISGGLADSPMEKHYVELTPLGRMGEPDDVALPAVFLASDDSRWISGELILVAGGE
jgi:NAD(P)-dependent dehydrogenase (short-subunit alcohol dehydrogenase family)